MAKQTPRQRAFSMLATSFTLTLVLTVAHAQRSQPFLSQSGSPQSLSLQQGAPLRIQAFPQQTSATQGLNTAQALQLQQQTGGSRLFLDPRSQSSGAFSQSLLNSQSQRLAGIQGSVSAVRPGSVLLDRNSALRRRLAPLGTSSRLGGQTSQQGIRIPLGTNTLLRSGGSLTRSAQFIPSSLASTRSGLGALRPLGTNQLNRTPVSVLSRFQSRSTLPRTSLSSPTAQTGAVQPSDQLTQDQRTAANTRVLTSRTLAGLQRAPSVTGPSTVAAQSSTGGRRVLTQAQYQELLRRRRLQQLQQQGSLTSSTRRVLGVNQPSFQPSTSIRPSSLSRSSLLLQKQQQEIARRRQELEKLKQELALRQQQQAQMQQSQAAQQPVQTQQGADASQPSGDMPGVQATNRASQLANGQIMSSQGRLNGQIMSSQGGLNGQIMSSQSDPYGETVSSQSGLNGQIMSSQSGLNGQTMSSQSELNGQIMSSQSGLNGQTMSSQSELNGQIMSSQGGLNGQTMSSQGSLNGQTMSSQGELEGQTMPNSGTVEAGEINEEPSAGAAQTAASQSSTGNFPSGASQMSAGNFPSGASQMSAGNFQSGTSQVSAGNLPSGTSQMPAGNFQSGTSQVSAGNFPSGASQMSAGNFQSGTSQVSAGNLPSGTSQMPAGNFQSGTSQVSTGNFPSGTNQMPAGNFPSGTSQVSAGNLPSGTSQMPAGNFPSGTSQMSAENLPSGTNQMPAGNFPSGTSQVSAGNFPSGTSQMPAGNFPSGTSQVSAGNFPSGTSQVSAGNFPSGTSQMPAGNFPSGTSQVSAGNFPAGTSQVSAGNFPSGTSQMSAGNFPSGTSQVSAGNFPAGTSQVSAGNFPAGAGQFSTGDIFSAGAGQVSVQGQQPVDPTVSSNTVPSSHPPLAPTVPAQTATSEGGMQDFANTLEGGDIPPGPTDPSAVLTNSNSVVMRASQSNHPVSTNFPAPGDVIPGETGSNSVVSPTGGVNPTVQVGVPPQTSAGTEFVAPVQGPQQLIAGGQPAGVAVPVTTPAPSSSAAGETLPQPPPSQQAPASAGGSEAVPTAAGMGTTPMDPVVASLIQSALGQNGSTIAPIAAGGAQGTNPIQAGLSTPMGGGQAQTAGTASQPSDVIATRDMELLMMIDRLNRQLDQLLLAQNQNQPKPTTADPVHSVFLDTAIPLELAGPATSGATTQMPPVVTDAGNLAGNPPVDPGTAQTPFNAATLPPPGSLERQMMELAYQKLINEVNGVSGPQGDVASFANALPSSAASQNAAQHPVTDPLAGTTDAQSLSSGHTTPTPLPNTTPASVVQPSQAVAGAGQASPGAASSAPSSPVVLLTPEGFDLKQAIRDPVFFNLLEAHLHSIIANGGSLLPQGPSPLSSPTQPDTSAPTVATQTDTQTQTTQAPAHAGALGNTNTAQSSTVASDPAANTQVGQTPALTQPVPTDPASAAGTDSQASNPNVTGQTGSSSPAAGFSLMQAIQDPVFVNLLETHLQNLIANGGSLIQGQSSVSQTASATPLPAPAGAGAGDGAAHAVGGSTTASPVAGAGQPAGTSGPTSVQASPVISQQDAIRAFMLAVTGNTSLPTSSVQNPVGTVSFNPWETSAQTSAAGAAGVPLTSSTQTPTPVKLPVVSQTTFQSMQTLYGALQLLKSTSSPTVMSQIKTLLQMFPPQQTIDVSKFQQITTQQLSALGISVSGPQETNAISASINALSQVYSIPMAHLLQLLSGKSPSQIAVVGQTTQNPAGSSTANTASTTINPLAQSTTTSAPSTTTTAWVGEIPEPGDPGFIDYYFKVGKQLTPEDLLMLKQQMAEMAGL